MNNKDNINSILSSGIISKAMACLGNCFNIILHVDLKSDKYFVVYASNDKVPYKTGVSGVFSDFINDLYEKSVIYKEDMMDFKRYFSIKSMKKFFSEVDSKRVFEFRYRINNNDKLTWIHTEAIADENYSDGNQSIYLFARYDSAANDGSIIFFENIIKRLSENFEAIFYIDFDGDKIYPYRTGKISEQVLSCFSGDDITYKAAMEMFINKFVPDKDKKKMFDICSRETVQEILKIKKSFSHEFYAEIDQQPIYFNMKFLNMYDDKAIHHGILTFSNINSEKQLEKEHFVMGKSILVVEDNALSREILVTILKDEYQVYEAADGIQALEILEEKYPDITLIITDLEMPNCDGYELMRCIRETRRYDSLPVIVATASRDSAIEERCLELGASDFVTKPYISGIVRNRIKSFIRLRETTAMLNTLEKDPVTGFYTKDFFFRYVEEIIEKNPDTEYRIVVSDIEKFKLINEKYGAKKGDEVLHFIAKSIEKNVPEFVIGGRINSDMFVCLQRKIKHDRNQGKHLMKILLKDSPVPNLILKNGIYYIKNDNKISPQSMYDRAKLAMESTKGVYGLYCAVYDDKLRSELMRQKQILDTMEEALAEGQLEVYYQPKHDLSTDVIGGSEALVRWNHTELGFMIPGSFIPLFEKNGFIKELDAYVFHDVCKRLKMWSSNGKKIVPVSVNLSRIDFEIEDLAERITVSVNNYGLDHSMIHFELTESVFAENPEQIIKTIKKLHDNGFIIELDDFGAGYSSLSVLNSMDFDVIKLDMSLVRQDKPGGERSTLEFAMQLAKMMKLKTVAEGVETVEQVERLKALGCDFVQGYYYSKPIPVSEYEKYLSRQFGD